VTIDIKMRSIFISLVFRGGGRGVKVFRKCAAFSFLPIKRFGEKAEPFHLSAATDGLHISKKFSEVVVAFFFITPESLDLLSCQRTWYCF
jgi:hypothetical protein